MNFIKKYLVLIICVLIVLAGVGLIVLGALQDKKNQSELSKIQSICKGVSSLTSNLVHSDVLKKLEKNAEQAEKDVEAIARLAEQTSNRSLFSEKIFPRVQELSSRRIYYQEFARKYCQSVGDMISKLKGGGKPSEREEIREIEAYRQKSGGGEGGVIRMPTRVSDSSDENDPEFQIVEELRINRAESLSIYADADAFCCYNYWDGHSGSSDDWESMLKSAWFTQIAAWIQEDVILSINQLNEPDQSVMVNPVKRLLEISFAGDSLSREGEKKVTRSEKRTIASRREADSQSRVPDYVRPGVGSGGGGVGNLLLSMTTPSTQRVSDDLIDVVHFEVGVVMEISRLMEFVNALQSPKSESDGAYERNQITVLDFVLEPINYKEEKEEGYYYGPGSFGTLRLTCEYFFFKKGYDQIKPEPVKKLLKPASKKEE